MNLLTVLLVVFAFLIACGLVALVDQFLSEKLKYPRWIIHFAYGLLGLVVILFICDQLGVWKLLSSVHT